MLRVEEPRVASPSGSFAGSDATRLHPHVSSGVVGRREVVDERAVLGMAQKTANSAFLVTRTDLSQRGRANRASPRSRDQTNGKLREQTGLSRAGRRRSVATSTRTPWRSDATVASLWWKSRSKRTPTFPGAPPSDGHWWRTWSEDAPVLPSAPHKACKMFVNRREREPAGQIRELCVGGPKRNAKTASGHIEGRAPLGGVGAEQGRSVQISVVCSLRGGPGESGLPVHLRAPVGSRGESQEDREVSSQRV